MTPKGQDGHRKRATLLEEVEETTFREDEEGDPKVNQIFERITDCKFKV